MQPGAASVASASEGTRPLQPPRKPALRSWSCPQHQHSPARATARGGLARQTKRGTKAPVWGGSGGRGTRAGICLMAWLSLWPKGPRTKHWDGQGVKGSPRAAAGRHRSGLSPQWARWAGEGRMLCPGPVLCPRTRPHPHPGPGPAAQLSPHHQPELPSHRPTFLLKPALGS